MKIFVSWSGPYSKQIATEIGRWIPYVLQQVSIFLSVDNVSSGSRWSRTIDAALEETDFGILVVTQDNYRAPWLLYEAGALAKNVTRSKVVPILCGTSNATLAETPLVHFQTVELGKSGILSVVSSIYEELEKPLINPTQLEEIFDLWWPQLEKSLSVVKRPDPKPKSNKDSDAAEPSMKLIEQSVSSLIGMVNDLRAEFHGMNRRGEVIPQYSNDIERYGPDLERDLMLYATMARKASNYSELGKISKGIEKLEEQSGLLPYVFEKAWNAVYEADKRIRGVEK